MANKKNYTKKEKEEFAKQKREEFDRLVEQSKSTNPDPISRSIAQKELKKRRKQSDRYLRKNEPAKWAEKLRKKADYYDEKAKGGK